VKRRRVNQRGEGADNGGKLISAIFLRRVAKPVAEELRAVRYPFAGQRLPRRPLDFRRRKCRVAISKCPPELPCFGAVLAAASRLALRRRRRARAYEAGRGRSGPGRGGRGPNDAEKCLAGVEPGRLPTELQRVEERLNCKPDRLRELARNGVGAGQRLA